MGPPQPASEIFIVITKEAQKVLRLPNDHVKKQTNQNPKPTHNTKYPERIWEEDDLCYSWIPRQY